MDSDRSDRFDMRDTACLLTGVCMGAGLGQWGLPEHSATRLRGLERGLGAGRDEGAFLLFLVAANRCGRKCSRLCRSKRLETMNGTRAAAALNSSKAGRVFAS